jgi:wyosine [tRNA(Phe)-imidazoG37] synthetase (radical SAM superfamily)
MNITRGHFFQPEVIYGDVARHIQKLKSEDQPDYLTFVSNGEPTIDINLGNTIRLLKEFGIPIAVITNGSLLSDKSARSDLSMADWVSIKVDAADRKTWKAINRPYRDLDFEQHIEYIFKFSVEYKGLLRTESMIVDSVNDTCENFSGLAEIIRQINPGIAYLSVPTRPPAETKVKVPEIEQMNLAWQIFNGKNIKTEFLTGFEGTGAGHTGNIYEDILNITAVHPLREDTLTDLLGKAKADKQVVESLISQKLIRSTVYNGRKFYLRHYHRSS